MNYGLECVTIREYVTAEGRNRYREWFDSLSAQAAAKASGAVARMAAGNISGLKSIGDGLCEWRIDWGPGLRIYVMQDGENLIVLFGGSDKSRQQAEIKRAKKLREEYQARKKANLAKEVKGRAGQKEQHLQSRVPDKQR